MWLIEYTDEFAAWWDTLDERVQEAIGSAVGVLQRLGPGCGRPLVDTVKGSRHANMKEPRPPSGNVRVLFAFDPRRAAILLIGGDKTNQWHRWYIEMIPVADALYDEHLDELRKEGLIP
jgi:hypothetical protein